MRGRHRRWPTLYLPRFLAMYAVAWRDPTYILPLAGAGMRMGMGGMGVFILAVLLSLYSGSLYDTFASCFIVLTGMFPMRCCHSSTEDLGEKWKLVIEALVICNDSLWLRYYRCFSSSSMGRIRAASNALIEKISPFRRGRRAWKPLRIS